MLDVFANPKKVFQSITMSIYNIEPQLRQTGKLFKMVFLHTAREKLSSTTTMTALKWCSCTHTNTLNILIQDI